MEGKTTHEKRLAADGGKRAALITGAASLAAFFETHDTDAPDLYTLSYQMQGSASERLARVDEIAEALGVHPQVRNGTYSASREFGPFKVEAHTTSAAARMATVRRLFGHHGRSAAA